MNDSKNAKTAQLLGALVNNVFIVKLKLRDNRTVATKEKIIGLSKFTSTKRTSLNCNKKEDAYAFYLL